MTEPQSKTITVLYADWTEFAAALDGVTGPTTPEQRLEELNAVIDRAVAGFAESGGVLLARLPLSLTAAWGVPETGDDDAERAVRAALALRDAVQPFASGDILALQIALTTGSAQVTQTSPNRYTASGDPLGVCPRLLPAIPEGGIVISHDTFRLVEGTFTLQLLTQLRLRGRKDPLDVYLVSYAKPRRLRAGHYGVEGVETRLIGREIEMKQLKDAFEVAMEERQAQLITVVGDGGLGKSRLLLELQRWRDLLTEGTWVFRARANPETLHQPYSLLQAVFMFRFQIQLDDPPAAVRTKLEAGVENFMGPNHAADAHLLGQLIGFELSDTPAVQEVINDAALFEQRALQSLTAFFRAASYKRVDGLVALYLEDMHWADDKSLDALQYLMQENAKTRLVILLLARPELLTRRPRWGMGLAAFLRIELHLLPPRDTRKLVREVLQKVPELPDALRDWIAERAGGNPMYVEELVKALIENGTIVKGEGEAPWQMTKTNLESVRVPDTLTGMVQARIERLPIEQRTLLQRAAVIGSAFWDQALSALEPGDGQTLSFNILLPAMAKRELIFRRESTAFTAMQEYSFASNLMREVVYTAIPAERRRNYHALMADWLARTGGVRSSEYAARIAEHYELAEQGAQAVPYLAQAATDARRLNAFAEARGFLERALARSQAGPSGAAHRATLLFQLGEVEMWQGDYLQAQEHLADSLDLAQQTNDERLLAEALSRLGWVAYYRGELSQGQQWLEQAITHARASGAQSVLVLALRQMGNVVSAQGGYDRARTCYEESLATARALNDHNSVAFVLNNLGTLELLTGHFDAAARYLHESLEICRTANNILGSAFALGNLVVNSYLTKDYAQARSYYEQQNALNQKLNTLVLVAEVEIWIGLTALATGSQAEARLHMSQALRVALQIDESPLVLAGLAAFARLEAAAGRPEEALELLGAVIDDPAMDDVVRVHVAKPLLAELHQALPPAAIPQIQARGRTNNPLTLARKLAGG